MKHYAVGENVQHGIVNFSGRKICKVTFEKPFENHPSVTITLEDSGSAFAPCRTKVSRTGFRVLFKTPYTGSVGWSAME